VIAVIAAVVMGIFGGLFPSFRAARTPITAALRET
jgi:ABC-type antimicrobial peptide transport system permease subunit